MNYFCCDEFRRNDVKDHSTLNGIDFLEVVDNPMDDDKKRQTTLKVHFLKPISPGLLTTGNVIIEGGERIKHLTVTGISAPSLLPLSPQLSPPEDEDDKTLVVTVKEAGDFSTYTLRIITDKDHKIPPAGFDPILNSIDFSFKVLCPSEFDCQPQHNCESEVASSPEINYLAKDYSSFRQLMLDRLSLLAPRWTERHPADVGITLVELLAYVGDYLSYQQDAIATEAYIGTARKRISIRRHARLVDYAINDGSNSRTWAHIEVGAGISGLILSREYNLEKTKFLTRAYDLPVSFRPDSGAFVTANEQKVKVFEMMDDLELDTRHNSMHFYTWDQTRCCLPRGAVSATLDGDFPMLKPGQVLIMTEIAGPETGQPGDADPSHTYPVRLTAVSFAIDPLGEISDLPPYSVPKAVTEIRWQPDDALPFPLCISSVDDKGETIVVSVVLGNNVLVDHGYSIHEELPHVPEPGKDLTALSITTPSSAPCENSKKVQLPVRYHPKLSYSPLTQAAKYETSTPPASALAARNRTTEQLLPCVSLTEAAISGVWKPQRDLLNSMENDKHFVAEIETGGSAYLRFGNDIQGQRPAPGTQLKAFYRVGNGIAGNIGSKAIAHLVSNDPGIVGANNIITNIWNPLPAEGGQDPESMELVRQKAPNAFRRQERAVTMQDYEDVSKRCSTSIQRSAATLRWTGSWRTVFMNVDRVGGLEVDTAFKNQIRNCIEKYRMAGQDLEVESPQFVSLEIEMIICVSANYFKSDIKAALLKVFSNRKLFNGRTGIFHPDNFTFGQAVYLSALYAAAQELEGVESVKITKFQRQGKDATGALVSGKLSIGRLEIARLDNDRNFPEHGIFNIIMQGGK